MPATAEDIRIYTAEPDLLRDGSTDLSPRDRDELALIERRLIACCLWDDPGLDDASELVTAEDFGAPHHWLFAICAELRAAGKPVRAATVYHEIVRQGRKDDVSAQWLADTLDLEPNGFHARYYATLVREASLFRRLRWAAERIAVMADRPTGPAAEVLGECEQLLFQLTDAGGPKKESFKAAADVVNDALRRVDDRQARGGALDGLSTGYVDLDNFLGGLRPSQLTVVGARPSVGKTALGLNVALNVAEAGHPVAFFSLEMPESEIGDRMLAMRSGVSMHRLTKGERLSQREASAIVAAAHGNGGGLGSRPVYVDDTPDQPAARIFALARRAVRKYGVKLVVVDYLQLMRPENPRENRTVQVGLMANRLRQMARECKVPVVALAQLNRDVENRNSKPRLSDLRESGEIEQHAHAVVLLHRPASLNDGDEVWPIDAVIAKNRNGPCGEIALAYRRPVMRFENSVPEFD